MFWWKPAGTDSAKAATWKIGLKAQDTSELFFDDVRVPTTNLLGEEGKGFIYLMQELAWERLQLSVSAVANMEAAVEWTI